MCIAAGRPAWHDARMSDDTIRLRQPDADTLRAWMIPTAAAFGEAFSEAEVEHERVQLELDRLIGAVDGETWVATGGAYSLRLTVPGGGEVGAAAITMIAVAPTHRRRGILRQMMRWLLDQARERGEPVAILWASEAAIYQRFGYGNGTLDGSFDIERTRVRFARPAEPLGRVRFVDVDEGMRLIPPIYEALRSSRPGWVSRSEVKWRDQVLADAEWMRHGNGPKFVAVLEVDGAARGYVIYRIKDGWDDRGPNNTLTAVEVTGLDAPAERALWEWLAGIDLVGHVKGWRGTRAASAHAPAGRATPHGFDHARRRVAPDPRRGRGARCARVRRAGLPHVRADRRFLPVEHRTLAAGRVGGYGQGPPRHGHHVHGDPDLTLDVSDLASVYLGAFTFADLIRSGRVGECREGAIAAADRLFATTVAPWCSTMF